MHREGRYDICRSSRDAVYGTFKILRTFLILAGSFLSMFLQQSIRSPLCFLFQSPDLIFVRCAASTFVKVITVIAKCEKEKILGSWLFLLTCAVFT